MPLLSPEAASAKGQAPLEAGDGVTTRRNNASPMGPWMRRKPGLQSEAALSPDRDFLRPLMATPELALVLSDQVQQGTGARALATKAGESLFASLSPWPSLASRPLSVSSKLSCPSWTLTGLAVQAAGLCRIHRSAPQAAAQAPRSAGPHFRAVEKADHSHCSF